MWPSAGIAPRRWKICWGCRAKHIYDERLYRALDRVLPHKEAIEQHLVKRLGELFELDYDLLLYDVTSTYFEGVADPNIAERGYSRDHRPDCVQVNIALVVTREGMPLGYEIFPGNTADVTTVEEIVEPHGAALRQSEPGLGDGPRHGERGEHRLAQRNGTPLRDRHGARGVEALVASSWPSRTDWRHIREDVEVKICRGPDGSETFLLCRSASRLEKEKAMHERFAQRIEDGPRLARRGASTRASAALDRGMLERQIGRLLERNSRAAGALRDLDQRRSKRAGRLEAQVERAAPSGTSGPQLSEGTYILRTNIHDWTDEELWKTYIQLTEAEAAFRIHKSDLCIRPIWHHKEGAHQSAHPGLLPRLRAVEDAAAMAIARRPGRFTAHHSHRALAHSRRRYRAAAR